MRLSATQAATGALTAAVVAGLLLLPGQLLGTESGDRTVITLPVTTAPAPVQAAAPAARKPARKKAPRKAVAKPHVQLVHVATLASRTVRTAPAVHHAAAKPRSSVRSALLTRLVTSPAVRAALAGHPAKPTKHATAAHPTLPAAPKKTTAATTTTTAAATAATPPPAPAPTPAPTVVAAPEQPAAPPTTTAPPPTAQVDGLRQSHHDNNHDGDDHDSHDHGHNPWDGRSGGRGHWR